LPGKKPYIFPLTATEKEAVSTHSLIKQTKRAKKPSNRSNRLRKCHWTESKAFLKSILIRHLREDLFLSYSLRSSWTTKILSAIFLPLRKAFWTGLMMKSRAVASLPARILEMTLYVTLQHARQREAWSHLLWRYWQT